MSFVAGCSSLNLKDNVSDVAGVATAVTLTSIGVPTPIALPAGVSASVAVNTVTQPEEIALAEVTNEHQAEVAETQIKTEAFKSIAIEGIIGAGVIFLLWTWLTWYLGARRARPQERVLAAERDESKRLVETLVKQVAKMKEQ